MRAMSKLRTNDQAMNAGAALGVAAAILYVFLWASAFVPSRILRAERRL